MSTRTIDELGAMKKPVLIGMKRKDTGCSIESEFQPPEDSRFEHRLMKLGRMILVLKRSDIFKRCCVRQNVT